MPRGRPNAQPASREGLANRCLDGATPATAQRNPKQVSVPPPASNEVKSPLATAPGTRSHCSRVAISW